MIALYWALGIAAAVLLLAAPATLLWLAGVIDDPFVAVAVTLMWLGTMGCALFILVMENDR